MINGVDVSGACPVLNAYGATATLEDKGGWLFQEWFEHAPNGQADFWVHPWTATEPVYTPNTLNTSLQASKEALATAVSSMEAAGSRSTPASAKCSVHRRPARLRCPAAWRGTAATRPSDRPSRRPPRNRLK